MLSSGRWGGAAGAELLGEGELAGMLKSRLPRYMIPNSIIRLEEMLFTANGKIDRKALKAEYQK